MWGRIGLCNGSAEELSLRLTRGCNILKDQGLDRDCFLGGAKQDSYITEVHRNHGTWHLLVLFPSLAQSRCCRNIKLFPAPLDWLSCGSYFPSLFPPLKHLFLQGSSQALCMAEASSTTSLPSLPSQELHQPPLPLLCSHINLGITCVIILKLHLCFLSLPNSKLSVKNLAIFTLQCFCCNLGVP